MLIQHQTIVTPPLHNKNACSFQYRTHACACSTLRGGSVRAVSLCFCSLAVVNSGSPPASVEPLLLALNPRKNSSSLSAGWNDKVSTQINRAHITGTIDLRRHVKSELQIWTFAQNPPTSRATWRREPSKGSCQLRH
jgi:hypothetical protein